VTHQLHPAQLRASAALHTLKAALAALEQRGEEEDRAIRIEYAARYEPLASPTFGRRHALGGHGDPTADAVGALGITRPNRWDEVQREVLGQLRDVAQHLPGLTDPMARLQNAVPHMSDRMADATRRLADRIDGRIRRQLRLDHDRRLLPRVPCPDCGATGLLVRTSPPLAERVVECTTCGQAWPWAAMVRSVVA
jgi:hypothetical protein